MNEPNLVENHFDTFLAIDEHAIDKKRGATDELEKMYWQGVCDGVRKLWAMMDNDPNWIALGGSSSVERPDDSLRKLRADTDTREIVET